MYVFFLLLFGMGFGKEFLFWNGEQGAMVSGEGFGCLRWVGSDFGFQKVRVGLVWKEVGSDFWEIWGLGWASVFFFFFQIWVRMGFGKGEWVLELGGLGS